MTEHVPTTNNDDDFWNIVRAAAKGEVHDQPNKVGSLATSAAEQQDLFNTVEERHARQRNEAGIMHRFVSEMPDRAIGNQPTIHLSVRRIRADNREAREISLRGAWVTRNPTTGNDVHDNFTLAVAYANGDKVDPAMGFDDTQANLVVQQIDELEKLRQEKILPNLNADCTGITDLSKAIAALPDQR